MCGVELWLQTSTLGWEFMRHLLPHLLVFRLNCCEEETCRNYLEKRGEALTLLDALEKDEVSEPRDKEGRAGMSFFIPGLSRFLFTAPMLFPAPHSQVLGTHGHRDATFGAGASAMAGRWLWSRLPHWLLLCSHHPPWSMI